MNQLPKQNWCYLTQMFKTFLPLQYAHEFTIDRTHSIPKPKHLPDNVPRDILARFHFYHIGVLMAEACKVTLFADILVATAQLRENIQLLR